MTKLVQKNEKLYRNMIDSKDTNTDSLQYIKLQIY